VTLTLSRDSINRDLIQEVSGMIQKHRGKTLLRIKVYDSLEKISIDLFSRGYRVELSKEFLRYLQDHPEFDFKID
jgi:DNA polymerase-3 subunit alpha